MKAIIYTQYGSPDVLQMRELEKPVPKDNQVLIKVHAASANPLDWHLMRGEPFLARFVNGLLKPQNTSIGVDIAGRVEAVGKDVKTFKPGDEVFGACDGSFAEYACGNADHVVPKPANLSFEAAASVAIAALTALQGLRNIGRIQAGQKVLVNGASGGVGTFAVQIAKSYGTEVTGVSSTRNLDMVSSIGADHVIDYTREDFTQNGQQYDLVFDAVGNRSVFEYARVLKPGGVCAIAGFTKLPRLFEHMLIGPLVSKVIGKQIGLMPTATRNHDDLVAIQELLAAGKVVPVIDKRYALDEAAEAIRYLETGRARGKVIITV